MPVGVVTPEILEMFPGLAEMGAEVGDLVSNGRLARQYSKDRTEEQKQEEVLTLTQDIIDLMPNLQEMDAAPGDKIVNGKLVKVKDRGTWLRDLAYSWDKNDSLSGEIATTLEAAMPLGHLFAKDAEGNEKLYVSPDEYYGEGFTSLPFDERRKRIQEQKDFALKQEYGDYQSRSGKAEIGGAFASALADPLNLVIPLGATIPKAAAAGAITGAGYEGLSSWNETGQADLTRMLIGGGFGAGIGAGAKWVGQALQPKLKPNGAVEDPMKAAREMIEGMSPTGRHEPYLPNRELDGWIPPSGPNSPVGGNPDFRLDVPKMASVLPEVGENVPLTTAKAADSLPIKGEFSPLDGGAAEGLPVVGPFDPWIPNVSKVASEIPDTLMPHTPWGGRGGTG